MCVLQLAIGVAPEQCVSGGTRSEGCGVRAPLSYAIVAEGCGGVCGESFIVTDDRPAVMVDVRIAEQIV